MARQRHDPLKDLVGFLLGDVMYAVRIEVVREIVNPLSIVDVPRGPSSVKGVADYRGEVVPVIDLRERFGLPAVLPSRRTKWVVLDVSAAGPRGLGRPQTRTVEPATYGSSSLMDSDASPRHTGIPDHLGRAVHAASHGMPDARGSFAERPQVVIRDTSGRAITQASYAALVVDSVTEVFGLGGGGLRAAPPLGQGDFERGIEGVTTFGSRLVFVLDARAFGPVASAALSWAGGRNMAEGA